MLAGVFRQLVGARWRKEDQSQTGLRMFDLKRFKKFNMFLT